MMPTNNQIMKSKHVSQGQTDPNSIKEGPTNKAIALSQYHSDP